MKDPLAVARRVGHDCWKTLALAERAEIEATLPREFRPQRLSLPRIPFPRRRRPDPDQPTLFDLDELPAQPEIPAELEHVQ